MEEKRASKKELRKEDYEALSDDRSYLLKKEQVGNAKIYNLQFDSKIIDTQMLVGNNMQISEPERKEIKVAMIKEVSKETLKVDRKNNKNKLW